MTAHPETQGLPRQPHSLVAVVLKGYPRLSETFIAQEILGLERAGLRQLIISLRQPTDAVMHPIHHHIQAPVHYLPEYLRQEPARVLRGVLRAIRYPGFLRALYHFARDLRRDRTRNRLRRFGQACVLATELPADTRWLHAHFLHTPASVACYAALLRDLPWSVSAHAKDIWTSPDWEITRKLASATWTVTCTRAGMVRLHGLAPEPERIGLVYHGLDPSRFQPPLSRPPRDGSGNGDPVRLLTVSRAVAKKGIDTTLQALALLHPGLAWRFTHVGGGPLLGELRTLAAGLGIAQQIEWRGPADQNQVVAACRDADLFILSSKTTSDGDRDGLPNVLMEAQAMGLAVIATHAGAINELILDGVTGILVPPDDPVALAGAITALLGDPKRRNALGQAGRERVLTHFAHTDGLRSLAQRFGLSTAVSPCESPFTLQ